MLAFLYVFRLFFNDILFSIHIDKKQSDDESLFMFVKDHIFYLIDILDGVACIAFLDMLAFFTYYGHKRQSDLT